ncbi:MAG: putative secreted protein, partial [Psychroserpens sp.]
MKTFLLKFRFLAFVFLLANLFFANAAFSQATTENAPLGSVTGTATIMTDKQDYPPGGEVIITGSGYQPNEIVFLQIVHEGEDPNGTDEPNHRPFEVHADGNGDISESWTVPTVGDSLGATFILSATGSVKADGSFTYAGWKFTDAINITTSTPSSGPVGQTVEITLNSESTSITSVSFGSNLAIFTFNSATKTINAIAPNGTGKIDITVSGVYNGTGWSDRKNNAYDYDSCTAPISTYTVTGGGAYCFGGEGLAVGLSNSETSVTYQLYKDAITTGSPVSGTGAAISFGIQAAGTYTVVARRVVGSCTSNMTGSVSVNVNPVSAVGAVSSNQTICTGSFPADMTIASATGTVLWQRADNLGFTTNVSNVGSNSLTLTSPQVGVLTATRYFRAVVTNGACSPITSSIITVMVNAAPVLASIGNKSVNEQANLSFTATSTDQDTPAQTLSFTLDTASTTAGMTINGSTGAFSWTPTEAKGGATYPVTITVTDNGLNAGCRMDSKTFDIVVAEVNVAPVLASIGNKNVDEQALLSFNTSATDQDLPVQTLTYSLNAPSLAAGMTIDGSTGAFSWTPTESQGGATYPVTITVTDNGLNAANLTNFETFDIVVAEVNVAPVLASIGNKNVDEQALLSFNASATDQDLPAQTLTYSLDA